MPGTISALTLGFIVADGMIDIQGGRIEDAPSVDEIQSPPVLL